MNLEVGDKVLAWYGGLAVEGLIQSLTTTEVTLFVLDIGPTWYGTRFITINRSDVVVQSQPKRPCVCGAEAVKAPGHSSWCEVGYEKT